MQALAGVDLAVEQGEFFGLLGPNGAGKTTLISILAGLTRADRGTRAHAGHDVVTDYRAARRMLGVVPQELVFDPFFTVRETLRIQSGYFGLRDNDAWIDEILHHLDLTSKADANMRSLSGGMKRRVLVGQALVHKPPVIVLDEPTAGVDVELRQSLWAFIRKLNRDGHTIILTTHYLEEAEALCDAHRDAEGGPRRRARHHAEPAVALRRAHGAARRARACRRRGARACCAQEPARIYLGARPLRRAREPARGAARARASRSTSSRCRRPTSSRCSCASWRRGATAAMHAAHAEAAGRMRAGHAARLADAALQGAAALLEGELPDDPAPVLTALLYLLIFSHVLEARVAVFDGKVRYTAFLIPGLVMMSVLQNAFANSSSSLIQSKITGNLIFVLLPPLSPLELFAAYVLGAMVRGLVVGLGVFVVTLWFVPSLARRAASVLGARVRAARQRDPRRARPHRRHLGRQVRPARRVPELHHRAADVPVGRVLLDPFAAAVLAGAVALQPVLLYDRRLPLRLLRRCRTCRRARASRSSRLRASALSALTLALLARGWKLRH